jgi:hypothetical protein
MTAVVFEFEMGSSNDTTRSNNNREALAEFLKSGAGSLFSENASGEGPIRAGAGG